ncbi:flagellar biosynthesis repressor FlbT [Pseudooceanicola sp.]|uniref:flagellar biosynthesis repressor FlbT n=1 Tax=Pseudooceanicola sp. TaxID=1914328 RepID=UPI0035124729
MVLKLTLKPYERFIVNGCAMRNSGRRHSIVIEEKADVVRGKDLLDASSTVSPVGKTYFLIQTALTRADLREKLVPTIQHNLAELATVFGPPNITHIFEAANFVSCNDYYKALRELRPVMQYERELMRSIAPVEQTEDASDSSTDTQDQMRKVG